MSGSSYPGANHRQRHEYDQGAPLPSTSSRLPPPPPPNWGAGQSFYLGGSAAPSSVSHARPAPSRGMPRQQAQWTDYRDPRAKQAALPPRVLLRDGMCVCCEGRVGYPRDDRAFKCGTCDTVTDLKLIGGASDIASQASIMSAEDVRSFVEQLNRPHIPASPFDDPTAPSVQDAIFVDALKNAFSNLPTIEASFRDGGRLPTLATLTSLYDLILSRPAALDAVRDATESILRRPGSGIKDSDGGWVITLLESPILRAIGTPGHQQRSWIVSRLVGLISNLPNSIHHALVQHLASTGYSSELLLDKVQMLTAFISLRIGGSVGRYAHDWGVSSGSRVMALLFAANNQDPRLPLSSFYCTLVDALGPSELVASFDTWEETSGAFSLCQYPFLLSLGVKIHLLAHDGKRQMEMKAQDAFRSTLIHRRLEQPFLALEVRRTHLVQDSLLKISNSNEELKKLLRIKFLGEDGVDAGGLRKEWFLLLCRQLFDPQFGMFKFDEDSHLCWFNPASLESSSEFYLVGVTLGLAIYNSVTLDVPLPLAVYKKLRGESVGLSDLQLVYPALARGLQALLDYQDDDVEDVFCRTFVGDYECWGEMVEVPLMEGGEDVVVTKANRHGMSSLSPSHVQLGLTLDTADYVKRYVAFLLTTSVSAQYDSFAQGFTEVTSGNALSLFRGAELELLVRGSMEPLDVEQLKSATVYEGFWGEEDPTVVLFWNVFNDLSADRQRKLLSFITGSDRIPATGTSALQLKLTCLGEDTGRMPTSHTCFNQLCLYRYRDRRTMEGRLSTAMDESEGFGLK